MLNQPAVKNRNLAMKINAVMRSFTVKMHIMDKITHTIMDC